VIVRQSASNIASFLLFFARAEEAVDFFILYFICFDRKKMTTKNNFTLLKNKSLVDSFTVDYNQYINLNLNQNRTCSAVTHLVQSESKLHKSNHCGKTTAAVL
jgi:predicted 3-demethylubiquinone-9 3-methyltransferase (glyoxalase superfamily)